MQSEHIRRLSNLQTLLVQDCDLANLSSCLGSAVRERTLRCVERNSRTAADALSQEEGRCGMRLIMATAMAITLAVAGTPLVAADREPAQRLDEATAVFSEIMAAPDQSIPMELLEKAHCIVIVPD